MWNNTDHKRKWKCNNNTLILSAKKERREMKSTSDLEYVFLALQKILSHLTFVPLIRKWECQLFNKSRIIMCGVFHALKVGLQGCTWACSAR